MATELSKTLGEKDGIQRALDAVASAGQQLLAGEPGSQEHLVTRARELVAASESPQNQAAWSFWAEVRSPVVRGECAGFMTTTDDYENKSSPRVRLLLASPWT